MKSPHAISSRPIPWRKAGLVIVIGLLCCTAVWAQPVSDSGSSSVDDDNLRTTLSGWADRHRLLVLDRRQNRGTRLYDRGQFRHVAPRKDWEYDLDMLAQRYTWEELGVPAQADNSLLLRVGSVRRDLFAFVSHLQSTVRLDTAHTLSISGTLQQDAVAVRGLLELDYEWRVAPRHAVGIRHTFSEYKPDLDVTPYYRYRHPRVGRAEVALTIQDVYSDLIDQHLSIPSRHRDVIRSYARQPLLISFRYTSPDRWPLRGELVGAIQPTAQALYASQTEPGYRYEDEERLHYVGALVEYSFASALTGGLFYKHDASWLHREGRGTRIASDYTAEQRFWRAGAFVRHRWGPLRTSIRVFSGGYRDHQEGETIAESLVPGEVDYVERQRGIRSRLQYRLATGPFTGIGYDGLQRTYDAMGDSDPALSFAPWVTRGAPGDPGPSNHRLVGYVGYRFSGGQIVVGFGADLDGDDQHPRKPTPKRFDNGFGRLILTW